MTPPPIPTRATGPPSPVSAALPPVPRFVTPYLVLSVTVVLTVAAAGFVGVSAHAKDLLRFNASIQRARDAITNRLDTQTALLRGGGGLFAAHPSVGAAMFHKFVER